MPKHYKEMMDEIINKMDEDAPTNSVAGGGVDMAPNMGPRFKAHDVTDKRYRKDKIPKVLRRFRSFITEPQ